MSEPIEEQGPEEEQPQGIVFTNLPNWKWSNWDLASVAVQTIGGVFAVLGQGCQLLARELIAQAQWERTEFDAIRAEIDARAERRKLEEAYEKLTGMDDYWLQPDAQEDKP